MTTPAQLSVLSQADATFRARELREKGARHLLGTFVDSAGVLRAMLLGDRSFVDRAESADFQKTGAFHVLVVAGMHVGAIAAVLFWAGRKLRLTRSMTMLCGVRPPYMV